MSLDQQLAMNFHVRNVPVPIETINIIKDYAFTHQITAFVKQKKKELVELFDQAIYSRKNVSRWTSETSESWIFMIYHNDGKCFKMEGCNCSDCGGYFTDTNPALLCLCPRTNPTIMHEDEEEFEQDWDFDDDPGADYP